MTPLTSLAGKVPWAAAVVLWTASVAFHPCWKIPVEPWNHGRDFVDFRKMEKFAPDELQSSRSEPSQLRYGLPSEFSIPPIAFRRSPSTFVISGGPARSWALCSQPVDPKSTDCSSPPHWSSQSATQVCLNRPSIYLSLSLLLFFQAKMLVLYIMSGHFYNLHTCFDLLRGPKMEFFKF